MNLDAGAAGELAAAAVPSGSTATFTDVAPGTYPVTVHVGLTQVFAGSINVAAGTVSSLTVTINAAAPGTVGPGGTDDDGSDEGDGSDDRGGGDDGGAATIPPTITTLPSTGSGTASVLGTYVILSIAAGLVAAGCLLLSRQRRHGA